MNYVLKEEDSLDARNCGVYRDRIDVYDGDNNISYVFTVLKIRREVLSLFSFSVSFSSLQVRALRLADPLSKASYQVSRTLISSVINEQ